MKYIVFILFHFAGVNGFSQSLFTDFTASQFSDSIFIKWTLKAGNTCFDMDLERSADNKNFSTIYSVPGLCGATEDLKYNYFDTQLNNSAMYFYRITASNDAYISDTISILWRTAGNNDIVTYPNPAEDNLSIVINNKLLPPYELEMYSLHGEIVFREKFNTNHISINPDFLLSGTYFIRVITEKGLTVSNKVLIK